MTDTRAPDAAAAQPEQAASLDSRDAAVGAAAPAADASAPPAGASEPAAEAADPLAAAEKDSAELKDKLLRALAEMENLRRRTEREVSDVRLYAVTQFARDILTVADNMNRAMQALDNEIRATADPGVKALLDGVEITERELLNVLEKHGVKQLDPSGQKFDPNLHQAMYETPDAGVPAGTIVQVIQAGYTIGERVLRPALVVVAKGGPKTGALGANDNTASPDPASA
jgi:molecular chaperone GrpE